MKIKINLHFRRFNGPKEDEDSGYFTSIDGNKSCRIDVNLDDEPFEQTLTVYHEVTHFILDLLSQYEIDNDKQKVNKRDRKLKDDWRAYNETTRKRRADHQYKEEVICGKVEAAVRKVLEKEMPKSFIDRFFTNKKKDRIMNTKKRRRK